MVSYFGATIVLPHRTACPGTATQTDGSGQRIPPERHGPQTVATPWPSVKPCRPWPRPLQRSRCLCLGPRMLPQPHGLEDVHLSQSQPRSGPDEREKKKKVQLQTSDQVGSKSTHLDQVTGESDPESATLGRSPSSSVKATFITYLMASPVMVP